MNRASKLNYLYAIAMTACGALALRYPAVASDGGRVVGAIVLVSLASSIAAVLLLILPATWPAQKESHRTGVVVSHGIAFTVLLFWLAVIIAKSWFGGSAKLTKPDDLSAIVQTVGALFTALAFAGVLISIYLQSQQIAGQEDQLRLQSKQLRLQRKELRLQRRELADTREEFKQQNRTMAQDLFERGFFQLLEMNRQALYSLRIAFANEVPLEGRTGFARATEKLVEYVQIDNVDKSGPAYVADTMSSWYEMECLRSRSDFSQYFRSLYHVLNFVDNAPDIVSVSQKTHYARIVRAQLATSEVMILLAHCHARSGRHLLPLAVKYEMFAGTVWPEAVVGKIKSLMEYTDERGRAEPQP